jgi:hypothetical protein
MEVVGEIRKENDGMENEPSIFWKINPNPSIVPLVASVLQVVHLLFW